MAHNQTPPRPDAIRPIGHCMLLPTTEAIKDLRLSEATEFFRPLLEQSTHLLSSAVLCKPPSHETLKMVLSNRNQMVSKNKNLFDDLSLHIGLIPEDNIQTLRFMVNESVVGLRHSAAAYSFLTLRQPSLKELAARVHTDLGFPANNFRMLPAQTMAQPLEKATVYPVPARINQLIYKLEQTLWSLEDNNYLLAAIIA